MIYLIITECVFLIFDLLLVFNLSTINPSLQPSSQLFSLLPMELLLLSSLPSDSESFPSRMTILTKIIGLKYMCFNLLLDLVFLSLLFGFSRLFNS